MTTPPSQEPNDGGYRESHYTQSESSSGYSGASREQAIGKADELLVSLATFSADVNELKTTVKEQGDYGRKNRLLITGTIASVVFDIVLTLIIFFVADDANDAAHKAQIASDKANEAAEKAEMATNAAAESLRTQKITCEASNLARAGNLQLWTYVLELSASNPENPQTELAKERSAQFRDYVETLFAPRDCDDLDDVPTSTPDPLPSSETTAPPSPSASE